jgi:hypothetical protein
MFLRRRGYDVHVYEARPDMRKDGAAGGERAGPRGRPRSQRALQAAPST